MRNHIWLIEVKSDKGWYPSQICPVFHTRKAAMSHKNALLERYPHMFRKYRVKKYSRN